MRPAPATSSFVTGRPVAVLMVFMATVVFGALSYERLPMTLMPDMSYPTLTVRTEYPGAAPEEVENDISRPIEEQLGVIGGLKKLSSVSRAGMSDVVLEFAWDTKMSDASQDVLEKLDLVILPQEAKRPLILHYDPSLDPVLELSLSGEGERFSGEAGLRRLRRLADQRIKKELEPIKGVAAVRVRGGLEEQIHVLLDEESLRRTGISIQTVIDRLGQENINVAGGTLREGRTEYLVRTLNEFESPEQIEDTIVATLGGRDVRVRDIGRVERTHKEREIVTRHDGGESVQIEIYKEGDANIVALARRVRQELGSDDAATAVAAAPVKGKPAVPQGLAARVRAEEGARLDLVADRSTFIESSVKEVVNTALLGGLLAVLVLYLFLRNFQSTAIIALSIPISLLVTFAPLHLTGVTLNIMSLGGLALGVGMLVDSSIVVLESIYRCREEGDGVEAAAVRGVGEVRGAVWASTMTTVAVFFPMVFVEGVAGQAFGDLGLAVVASLLVSTAVALYFVPMLSGRPALGLSVAIVFTVVLLLVQVASAAPRVAQGIGLAVVVVLAIGFFHTLIRQRTRRIELDAGASERLGITRWASLAAMRRGQGWPIRAFRAVGARGSVVRFLARSGVLLLALPFWIYLYGIRFLVGSIVEWLGKAMVMSFLGTVAIATRMMGSSSGNTLGRWLGTPARKTAAFVDRLQQLYPHVIRAALRNPVPIAGLVVVCLWLTWNLTRRLDSELLPEVHQGEFTVEVQLPVGTPLERTEAVVAPVEQAILAEKEHIASLILTVGYDSTNSQRSDEGEHSARFKVLLDEDGRGAEIEEKVIERLRRSFADIPDLEARVVRPVLFSFKTPIEVEVHGSDLYELKRYADLARAEMARLPGLADVETTLRTGAPEVQVVYDRERLNRFGLNLRDVARLVRDKVQGFEATRYNLGDRRIPIIVRLDLPDRETVEDVRAILVNPGGERPVRLADVASVTLGEGPSEVRRIDGQRVAVIGASIADGSLGSATERIREVLDSRIDWPVEMTYLVAGQNEEWDASRKSLWIALGLSVFLVYVIMAAQFESLVQPLVIMLTIPLAFVGTVLALTALGMALSIVVFLGMILLAGIVVNNAIVLIDYVNTLRARGMSRDDALVTAGRVRLRPILMTTGTTVLGLLPMALGIGDGAEIRTPLAVTVISGLTSSTFLTLIVIPTIYALVDSLKFKLLGRDTVPVRATGELPADGSEVATP